MDLIGIASLFTGVASIILAIVSMRRASRSEQRSNDSFENAKTALSEIREKARGIDRVVSDNQTTLINAIAAVAAPKQMTAEERVTGAAIEGIFKSSDPMGAIEKLLALADKVKPKT